MENTEAQEDETNIAILTQCSEMLRDNPAYVVALGNALMIDSVHNDALAYNSVIETAVDRLLATLRQRCEIITKISSPCEGIHPLTGAVCTGTVGGFVVAKGSVGRLICPSCYKSVPIITGTAQASAAQSRGARVDGLTARLARWCDAELSRTGEKPLLEKVLSVFVTDNAGSVKARFSDWSRNNQ